MLLVNNFIIIQFIYPYESYTNKQSGDLLMFTNKKTILSWLGAFFLVVVIMAALMPFMISGHRQAIPDIIETQRTQTLPDPNSSASVLKIMTLNMAHGRGNSFSQLFLSENSIDSNLDDIARVLIREKPHIVGFQEADGPSFWSGGKDHIRTISEKADYYFSFHGYHIRAPFLAYGTALASRIKIENPSYLTFSIGLFAPPKGFSVASFKWPGTEIYVDIVILHLDFISESKRNRQIEEITSYMKSRKSKPLIVMGDFNSSWNTPDSSVKKMCNLLKLKAFMPEDENLSSFPFSGKRIDWILISDQMKFVDYRILQDKISDHLGVVSEIGLN